MIKIHSPECSEAAHIGLIYWVTTFVILIASLDKKASKSSACWAHILCNNVFVSSEVMTCLSFPTHPALHPAPSGADAVALEPLPSVMPSAEELVDAVVVELQSPHPMIPAVPAPTPDPVMPWPALDPFLDKESSRCEEQVGETEKPIVSDPAAPPRKALEIPCGSFNARCCRYESESSQSPKVENCEEYKVGLTEEEAGAAEDQSEPWGMWVRNRHSCDAFP